MIRSARRWYAAMVPYTSVNANERTYATSPRAKESNV